MWDILTIIFHLAPAREAVTYEARTFNTSLFARNKYNGTPRPESSDAWEEISEGKHLVKFTLGFKPILFYDYLAD